MLSLVTFVFLNSILQTAGHAAIKQYRRRMVLKWAKGEMTLEQLHWLKRQPWFQTAFKNVSVSPEKKNN